MHLFNKNRILLIVVFTLFLLPVSYLIYNQVFHSTYKLILTTNENNQTVASYISIYTSDMTQHIQIVNKYFHSNFYLPHPLWHIIVYVVSKIPGITIQISAVIVSIFFLFIWLVLMFFLIEKLLGKTTDIKISLFVLFIVFFIGPLNIPWYNGTIYYGVGSPNIWHNVTLWAVKPFALLSVWFTIIGIKLRSKSYLGTAFLVTILSIFAKPSYIIMFLPALFIYFLIKKSFHKTIPSIYFILLSITSVFILAYQYTHAFNDGNKVIIDLWGVWMTQSENIPLSIVLATAFPMFFTLFHPKVIHDDFILLSWIMTFIGIVYFSLFAQSGNFYTHGNFGWSYMIALSLLYFFSIVKYFKIYDTIPVIKRYSLLMLLTVQLAVGLVYFYGIVSGLNPFFIQLS